MKQLSLLEGEYHCCGALCPKHKAQQYIDRMQRTIDLTHEFFNLEYFPDDRLEQLMSELKELASY